MKFLMKLPGKPDKIITNIVLDKLRPQVEKLGGTLVELDDEEVKVSFSRSQAIISDMGL